MANVAMHPVLLCRSKAAGNIVMTFRTHSEWNGSYIANAQRIENAKYSLQVDAKSIEHL